MVEFNPAFEAYKNRGMAVSNLFTVTGINLLLERGLLSGRQKRYEYRVERHEVYVSGEIPQAFYWTVERI